MVADPAVRRAAFAAAELALAASGTVSLELAANGVPMVIGYDTAPLTRWIVGRMLRVDTVTLVNLVSGSRTVPEFLGRACRPQALAGALDRLLADPAEAAAQQAAMALSIFSMLIAGSRNPAPILQNMPVGATIGVAAALAYRMLDMILPDPASMAVLLAVPFIAIGAALRSHPRSAAIGLDANMCFLLVAEAGAAGHGFSAHFQGGIALLASAVLCTALFRRIGVVP